MSDKYQKAVAYLTEHPEEIYDAWMSGGGLHPIHPAACLFKMVSNTGESVRLESGKECGCLTMIKNGGYVAETPELTVAIRADERIPYTQREIKPEHLPVFAEWQARIDKELGRGNNKL